MYFIRTLMLSYDPAPLTFSPLCLIARNHRSAREVLDEQSKAPLMIWLLCKSPAISANCILQTFALKFPMWLSLLPGIQNDLNRTAQISTSDSYVQLLYIWYICMKISISRWLVRWINSLIFIRIFFSHFCFYPFFWYNIWILL